VPEGISVEEARTAVDESDEITAADIEYAAALEDLPSNDVPEDFYETPDQLPDENGAVVKQSPSTFYLDPVKLIEHRAKSTAFMYKTTDEQGNARAATATLLTPEGASGLRRTRSSSHQGPRALPTNALPAVR
jgi:hypothetical protein